MDYGGKGLNVTIEQILRKMEILSKTASEKPLLLNDRCVPNDVVVFKPMSFSMISLNLGLFHCAF